MSSRFLPLRAAAHRLHYTTDALRLWCKAGMGHKDGAGRWLIDIEAAEARAAERFRPAPVTREGGDEVSAPR